MGSLRHTRDRRAPARGCLIAAASLMASRCAGVQSALAPAGREADRIASLFWWMTGASFIIWIFVVSLAVYYARRSRGEKNRRRDFWLIFGGGVVFPGVTLTILLIYGLGMIPSTVERAPEGSLQVSVTGEQWWWRVRYARPGGQEVVLANEIRVPVGQPTQLRLDSDNVIHSFWVPSLAGKMDMIPGRVTWLTLRPTATGVFRGACAEYCGTSHALMAFYVEVMEPQAFEQWLDHQARPAVPAADPQAARGGELFAANGCGACHTVRGSPAAGVIGPDLTHVGGRLSVGAGILQNDPATLRDWLASTDHLKPGVHMPAFGMLPDADLAALAAYLHGLK
ncbi:MAG TPA: cytochrome c oxidase subunit II [Vicinamibacterales bacterium]